MTTGGVDTMIPDRMAETPDHALLERFESMLRDAKEQGRVLLDNRECRIVHHQPFQLAFECRGETTDSLLRHLGTYAAAVGGLVGGLAMLGVIPLPIAAFGVFWGTAGLGLRAFASRLKRRHGEVLIDFDAMEAWHRPELSVPEAPAVIRIALDEQVAVHRELPGQDDEIDEPQGWLSLRHPGQGEVRLAHASDRELSRTLMLFRQYGVTVAMEPSRLHR